MEKFLINCTMKLVEKVEVIAKNEDEACKIAEEMFTDKFTNEYLDSGMDFEVLAVDELVESDHYDFYEE